MTKPRRVGPTLHLVLRAAESSRIAGRRVNLLDEHNSLARRNGVVALAKFGAKPGDASIDRLVCQIASGRSTRLYLVFKRGSRFSGYAASMSAIRMGQDAGDWTGLAPSYYADVDVIPGLWLLLRGELRPAGLADLRLATNGRKLLDVVAECRTAAMLVTTQKESGG